jgi:hypothetical protein
MTDQKQQDSNSADGGASALTARLGGGLRRAVLWLTGRDLLEPPPPRLPQGAYWTISGPPEMRWEMTLSADVYIRLRVPTGPNVLHRMAQRLALGIRWRMLPKTPNALGMRV